ncbi:unnamed protein product [Gongylonema pulchrum]|uniref:FBD domain-containing protein n=1 Tax=Gongylonema pulchrum TaxID=637853 RepID=A0A183EU84_9BILA|nr:unnamed protein product [Gongylonema pulchrum]
MIFLCIQPGSPMPFKWSPVLPTVSMKKLDAIYEMRWAKKPKKYIVKYFKECRQIEVMKLNFCDFFTDRAIEHLIIGRPSRTVRNIEIVANPYVSDNFVKWITRIRGLQRAHFYFLPCVTHQKAFLETMKNSLPNCLISFPELQKVGFGYDSSENSNKKSVFFFFLYRFVDNQSFYDLFIR